MEFTEEQWRGLKKHADERGIKFLSSPFSLEAVDLLAGVGVAAWKVASGEVSNTPMFERMIATGWPIMLSTGMSPIAEIDDAVKRVKTRGSDLTVLQCTSVYPCPPAKVGLNLIPFFRNRYDCHIGLSDHSGTIYPGLAAATLGIEVLEVHVTLNREMFGPDVPASVTTAELSQLVEGVRFIEAMRRHPVDKEAMAGEMTSQRALFTKSIVARLDLSAGTILRAEDLAVRKPGTGIPASRLPDIVGHKLSRSIKANELLKDSDVA
jgi:N-acetylneuraminate synthase